MEPRVAPDFSKSAENLPPISTPRASTMIDFPDPVAQERRLRPLSNSTRNSSISAMLDIFRSCSINATDYTSDYSDTRSDRHRVALYCFRISLVHASSLVDLRAKKT